MTHRCGQIRTRLALGLMISLGVMLGCTPDGGSDGGREDTSADDDGMSGSNLFDLDYLGGSDCGRSLGCDTYGWCTRDENSEQCVVGSDADCRRSGMYSLWSLHAGYGAFPGRIRVPSDE